MRAEVVERDVGLSALTKGGLTAATKSLAIEYSHNGIRVNAIAPGKISTPMHADDDSAFLAAVHPLGRMGSMADIVEGILYLENATFVTGEILHIDGGQSSWALSGPAILRLRRLLGIAA
ncbi:MAG: SDR family oxidoreductase [Mycobacterium sp.]|uniref:SDR family oxidoreductase n=1 Tax=Mycobacterium sp. TaxID=1785 RepID=UPI003F989569